MVRRLSGEEISWRIPEPDSVEFTPGENGETVLS